MSEYKEQTFPKSRVATIDVCTVGMQKHHIAALIEVDVTETRKKIKRYKNEIARISFTAWLIKAISVTVKDNERSASYLKGKKSVVIFNDINVSLIVEKEIDGQKVPIPLIIEKANELSIESITRLISDARMEVLTKNDIVLKSKSTYPEQFYSCLPGFLRRYFWRYLLRHPHFAYSKMGNVGITSLGMMGNVNGWFIPTSVHPVCFGISSITKKPVVVDDKVEVREVLNMTILLDHDVIDGAPMARFISDLSRNLEQGIGLQNYY